MYFYLFHHLMHRSESAEPTDSQYRHGSRNVRTLVLGGIAYIFTAAFLHSSMYQHVIQSVFLFSALRDWFMWILMLDIVAMAVIYKLYWGDSIVREIKAFVPKEPPKIDAEGQKMKQTQKPEQIAEPVLEPCIATLPTN